MIKELIRERIKEEDVINLYNEFENFIYFQKWEKKLDTKEYHIYLENLRNDRRRVTISYQYFIFFLSNIYKHIQNYYILAEVI